MKSKLIALIFSVVLVLSAQVCANINKLKNIIYNEVDITQPLVYEPFGKIYSEHGIDFKLAHYFPECMLYKYYIPEKCDRSFPHFIEQEGGSVQCVRGHVNYVRQIIQLNAQYIASSSADKTIKIWDLEANECIATLEGHTDEVGWLIRLSEQLIASCSDDETVKVWDVRTGICIPSSISNLPGAWGGIVKLNNDTVAIAFVDNSIQVWSLNSNHCVARLTGHTKFIQQVIKLDDHCIASCSEDKTIKIWNLDNQSCIATLEGHIGTVCDIVKLEGNRIASCSNDSSIKIWDLASHSCVATLNAHPKNYDLHMISLADGNIVSCAGDGIKIWDSISGKCIAHYTVKDGWVSYVTQLIDGRIAVNHSSQRLGSCAMMRIFDLYPRDLSFEQIALIVHLEKYFEQGIPVVLGDGWKNVFEMLPQYFKNRFESIMQVCKL